MSDINPVPLRPRLRLHSGAQATLATLTRKWLDNELIYTDENPEVIYRGTKAGDVFANLQPISGGAARKILTAINATATATAAAIKGGVITSTSAAAVALTLPTATALGTALKAARGVWVDFAVDNNAGANIVTVTVNTGIVAATSVLTGGATLTVAAGAVGFFRIYFKTATTAVIYRMA